MCGVFFLFYTYLFNLKCVCACGGQRKTWAFLFPPWEPEYRTHDMPSGLAANAFAEYIVFQG